MTESEKLENAIATLGTMKKQFLGETINVIDVAIESLEKQIPKKPDCIEDKMYCCPVCGNNLLHKWIEYPTKLMPKSEGLPHCMSCGQAIDWSN